MLKLDSYVPSLRWRLAEYQALMRLRNEAKDRVVPFIVIPKPEYDFEKKRMKKTVQEQVEPFAKQFKKKWQMRPAWIDVQAEIETTRLSDGVLPIAYIFDELRTLSSNAVPVVCLTSPADIVTAVSAVVKADKRGLGLRVRLEHMMRAGCSSQIDELLRNLGASRSDTDLIVDLGAPNYEPYSEFALALQLALKNVGDLSSYRSFVLIGTAFPESLGIAKPGGELIRHDWSFYEELKKTLPPSSRLPTYGDCTTVSPSFNADIDFRKAKPAGKLIYTFGRRWIVRKGGAFVLNRAQMHDHCEHIVSKGYFRGSSFSDGDDYIEKCAQKSVKPTNQTRWKEVAISHHIMHVLEDLAIPAEPA